MASGKWIRDLEPNTPLTDAARLALKVRFATVRDYLPLALHEPMDPEGVHRIRVGTRRARAALDVFRICLPEKRYRQARRAARQVRRVAGAARDGDVFLAALVAEDFEIESPHRPGIDFLIGHALALRQQARDELRELAAAKHRKWNRLPAGLAAAVRPPRGHAPTTLSELARTVLPDLIRDLSATADAELTQCAPLHRVRIAGKRLRYGMELFAACFVPAFRDELYPRIEEMQELLGRANDSRVACQRMAALREHGETLAGSAWQRFEPGIDAVMAFHDHRLSSERPLFEEWWRRWKGPGGEPRLLSLVDELGSMIEST